MLHDHKNDLAATTFHTSTDECWCAKEIDTIENTWGKFQNELQQQPKVVGCLVCGFRSENEIEIEDFQENGCPDCTKEKEIRSMFIECREWFDKVNGNSYFSARIWINGGQVAIIPFSYGYGDFYIYEAQKKLLELGYLPQENKNNSLFTISQLMGFDFYSAKTTTNKKEMFKHYANYSEIKAGN